MTEPEAFETNRDKALCGQVVQVSDARLREMQGQAIRLEGIGENCYHWHWIAVINELIARRTAADTAPANAPLRTQEAAAMDALPKALEEVERMRQLASKCLDGKPTISNMRWALEKIAGRR